MKEYTWKNKVYITFSIILILIFWSIVSKCINNEIIVPSINSTIKSLKEIVKNENFLLIVSATMFRCIESFGVSLAAAIIFGIAASFSKIIYNFMLPISSLLKAVPTMGIVVLALIWLSSENAPILIGFIVVFPIFYESVLSGITGVDNKLIEMAHLFKVSKFKIVKEIYIPCILMSLNNVINSAFGLNFKVVIAGEVLGQPKYSIGSNLQLEKMYLNTPGVFAWIIIIVLITLCFDLITRLLHKKTYKWK